MTLSRHAALFASILLASLLLAPAGCVGTDGELPLRAGFEVLYRSEIPARRQNGSLGWDGQAFLVTDASVSGRRVIVAGYEIFASWSPTFRGNPTDVTDPTDYGSGALGASGGLRLYVSEDDAATWRSVDIRSDSAVLSRIGVADVSGDPVISYYARGSRDIPDAWLGRIDLATGELTPTLRWESDFTENVGGTVVRHIYPTGLSAEYFVQIYDIAEHASRTTGYRQLAGMLDTACTGEIVGRGELGLVELCYRRSAPEAWPEVCVAHYGLDPDVLPSDPDGDLQLEQQVVGCVSTETLDPPLPAPGTRPPGRGERMLFTRRHLWTPYEFAGRVWLRGHDLDDGEVTPPVDLGFGELEGGGFGTLHGRLPRNIIGVVDTTRAGRPVRYLRPSDDGPPIEIAIPQTPCTSDLACPSSLVALRALPSAPDRLLAVYDVRTSEHQYVVAGTIPNPEYVAPTPGPEGSVPGGPLDRACTRLRGCFPSDYAADFGSCMSYWSQRRGGSTATDLAYQAFLATPPGDCEAFRGTYAPIDQPGDTCTPGCIGEVAVRCYDTGGGSAENCRERGTTCRVRADGNGYCGDAPECPTTQPNRCEGEVQVACSGTEGSITDCGALGLTCHETSDRLWVSCVDLSLGACDLSWHCVGDELVSGCTADGLTLPGIDCSRLGVSCDAETTRCAPMYSPQCSEGDDPTCDGTHVQYCVAGERRAVDCASIGFRTCDVLDTRALCIP